MDINMNEIFLAVSRLNKLEKKVIELRYVKKLTYADIGSQISLGRERARQIKFKAIQKLRNDLIH